ncbi:hypothetical protein M8J75_000119 [Diaphorina citri]|nr:hypothetical protein M8J75_000119 [Diaphorina citri]
MTRRTERMCRTTTITVNKRPRPRTAVPQTILLRKDEKYKAKYRFCHRGSSLVEAVGEATRTLRTKALYCCLYGLANILASRSLRTVVAVVGGNVYDDFTPPYPTLGKLLPQWGPPRVILRTVSTFGRGFTKD